MDIWAPKGPVGLFSRSAISMGSNTRYARNSAAGHGDGDGDTIVSDALYAQALYILGESRDHQAAGMPELAPITRTVRKRLGTLSMVLSGCPRLHVGLHEAAHLVNRGFVEPPLWNSTEEFTAYRAREESVADLASAVYMLNRYQDNPRVLEFFRLWVLSRNGSLASTNEDGRLTHGDIGPALERLLASPENWRVPSGRNITLLEATAHAQPFVDRHQGTLASPTVAQAEEARTTLCLYDGNQERRNWTLMGFTPPW